MKQQLHHRLCGRPLLSENKRRPLSVSLLLSLVVVLHSVSSFDEESALGQKRPPVYKEGRQVIPKNGDDKPIDELHLSLIENLHLKKRLTENPHKPDSQNLVAKLWGSECPKLKELTATRGYITFPMSGDYGNNLNCRWQIVAPPDKVIQLEVLWIDIETTYDCYNCCSYDRLQLYDGRVQDDSSPMATLCGNEAPPEPYTTTSSEALVVFQSDVNIGYRGFALSYRIIPSECGIPDVKPKVDSRIIGGVEATPHSWPWQVLIRRRVGRNWYRLCGGSVFYPHWVITAAHCFFNDPDSGFNEDLIDPADLKIVLGEHNISKTEGTEQEFKVKKRFIHEGYNNKTKDNDIALIRLSEDAKFNRYVKPICLPDDDVKDGTLCVATGWGDTQKTVDENVLNQVSVPVINNSLCNQSDWNAGNVTDNMICAGYPEGGKDSCGGDSGGPLVSFSHSEGKWKLYGVTSWGFNCATHQRPGVYTRVKNYLEWIQEKTKQYDNELTMLEPVSSEMEMTPNEFN